MFGLKNNFYITVVLALLLLGCSSYPSARKDASPPPSKEMGRAFVKEALQHYRFVKDPDVVNLVNSVGRRIVSKIGANPDSYHFLVVRENQPNAFAIPGGYIFVFDGLLPQLRDEGELAGVLAHEIAHVERSHFFKDDKKIAALDIATIAAILLSGGNPAALTLAGAANLDVRLQFSRENEREADSYAMRYLEKGGYSSESLLNFFDSLIRYERFNPQTVPAYASTHPGLEERRDRVASFLMKTHDSASTAADTDSKTNTAQKWTRMQASLLSRNIALKDESILLQSMGIEKIPEERRDETANYLLGIVYMKAGLYSDAIPRYLKAIGFNEGNYVYYADLAYCYLKQQDIVKSREAALKSISLNKDYAPAHVIMGILEMDSDNLAMATSHLEDALRLDETDDMVNFYLAMAYRKSGESGRDAFYSARYFKINLDPDRALKEFNRAKDLVKTDTPMHFRILQEIDEIKREGL
ncbi:MAG: M48 family metalloprotease [Nitrospirae bacterium]|nr:M48 family metalloprotease [Nitrospirota bacterium]